MIILRHKSGHSIGIDELSLSKSFEVYSLYSDYKIEYKHTGAFTLNYLLEIGYRVV